jgi:hypothetical protein
MEVHTPTEPPGPTAAPAAPTAQITPGAQDETPASGASEPGLASRYTEPDPREEFVRIPGLLRRWEISQVVSTDSEFLIEDAGQLTDHTPLYAVYEREPPLPDASHGVPVSLSFDEGLPVVKARLLPIDAGEPLMAILVFGDDPDEATRVHDYLQQARRRASAAANASAAGGNTKTPQPESAPR